MAIDMVAHAAISARTSRTRRARVPRRRAGTRDSPFAIRSITPESAARILEKMRDGRRPSPSELVFRDLPPRTTIRLWLHKACDAASIPRLRIHDLRHRTAHYLARLGAHELLIAKMLGHSAIQTTRRYTDHNPEAFANQAVALLNAAAAVQD